MVEDEYIKWVGRPSVKGYFNPAQNWNYMMRILGIIGIIFIFIIFNINRYFDYLDYYQYVNDQNPLLNIAIKTVAMLIIVIAFISLDLVKIERKNRNFRKDLLYVITNQHFMILKSNEDTKILCKEKIENIKHKITKRKWSYNKHSLFFGNEDYFYKLQGLSPFQSVKFENILITSKKDHIFPPFFDIEHWDIDENILAELAITKE